MCCEEFKVLLRKRGGAREGGGGRRARSGKHNDVGKLCIKYTVGYIHGTRVQSILSVPEGRGWRTRSRGRRGDNASRAQCSVAARVST